MAMKCSQATVKPCKRWPVVVSKVVIRWCWNVRVASTRSKFPIRAGIAAALTASILKANSGSSGRQPSSCQFHIFLVTFTVPNELRAWFWEHQRTAYDLLLRTAWLTVQAFGRRDPQLNGQMGAHAVLHTHNRRLEYHPHVHLIVPAGAVNKKHEQWRSKGGKYLFPVANLSRVYRAKWFEALSLLGVEIRTSLPSEWVVHCKAVGRGDKALTYLGRYLYRGVLPEKYILKDQDGNVTFKTIDNKGAEIIQTLPGVEFLWLLLRHVLPKRFRRVRDFGLLHGNAKVVVRLLQILLNRIPLNPIPAIERQPMVCPECGSAMRIIAVRVKEVIPLRL